MQARRNYLTYLASPYSHPDPAVKEQRAVAAAEAAKWLMDTFRWNCFSPIVHSHPLHLVGMRGDWPFWQQIDTEYLEMSERLVVLGLDGWRESVGVTAELEIAKRLEIPRYFISLNPYELHFKIP